MKKRALCGKPISELWSITYRWESHTVTCQQTQVNDLIPVRQIGTQFTYPGGMEG